MAKIDDVHIEITAKYEIPDSLQDSDQQTLFERIDELTWSDCATCRVWRAAILIGFTIALTIDIGLRLWT